MLPRAVTSRIFRVMLQVVLGSFTREKEGMAVVANSAFVVMLRDGIAVRTGIDRRAVNVCRGRSDSVRQIGTQFNRSGDIGRGLLLIYAHQDRGEGIKECIRAGLLYAPRVARRNRPCDFLRGRSHRRTRKRHK